LRLRNTHAELPPRAPAAGGGTTGGDPRRPPAPDLGRGAVRGRGGGADVHPKRRKGTRPVAALAVLALLVFGLAPVGLAQDCPNRGLLDAMYCDADGDLVADAPTDPSQWV